VWFFAGSRQDGRLYRYRPTDGLRSWVLGTTDNDRWGGLPPSAATEDDGTAYVALNDTLAHLDPATGVFAKLPVPVGLIDPIADAYGPPEIRSSDPIMAIASDGTDHVAIIRRVSSIVQIYDPVQRRFSSVPVPSGYQAIAVGYLANRLVVGLYNWHAQAPNTVAVYTTESIPQPDLVRVRDSQRLTPTSTVASWSAPRSQPYCPPTSTSPRFRSHAQSHSMRASANIPQERPRSSQTQCVTTPSSSSTITPARHSPATPSPSTRTACHRFPHPVPVPHFHAAHSAVRSLPKRSPPPHHRASRSNPRRRPSR
jgi:hypothetical protein